MLLGLRTFKAECAGLCMCTLVHTNLGSPVVHTPHAPRHVRYATPSARMSARPRWPMCVQVHTAHARASAHHSHMGKSTVHPCPPVHPLDAPQTHARAAWHLHWVHHARTDCFLHVAHSGTPFTCIIGCNNPMI